MKKSILLILFTLLSMLFVLVACSGAGAGGTGTGGGGVNNYKWQEVGVDLSPLM